MAKLTDYDKIEIVRRFKGGELIKDIAASYGVCSGNVGAILTRRGCTEGRKKRLNQEVKNRVIDLYQEGLNPRQIAKIMGLKCTGTAQCVIKRSGIKVRGNQEVHKKYIVNRNILDNIDTEEKAYFLGFFYADGYNSESRNTISINLQEEDKDVLEKFQKLFESNCPLRFTNGNKYKDVKVRKNQYGIYIHNYHISQRLKELGAPQAKSLIIEFPVWLKDDLKRHFVRGYFDGDGYFGFSQKTHQHTPQSKLQITSTYIFNVFLKEFIKQEVNIGGRFSLLYKSKHNLVNLYYGGNNNVIRFMDWIYDGATIYLQRKFNKYQEFLKIYNSKEWINDNHNRKKPFQYPKEICQIANCGLYISGLKLCKNHYDRYRKLRIKINDKKLTLERQSDLEILNVIY